MILGEVLQMDMEDLKEFIEFINSLPEDSLGHDLVIFVMIFGTFLSMIGLSLFLMKKFPELNGTSSAVTNDQKEPIGE